MVKDRVVNKDGDEQGVMKRGGDGEEWKRHTTSSGLKG